MLQSMKETYQVGDLVNILNFSILVMHFYCAYKTPETGEFWNEATEGISLSPYQSINGMVCGNQITTETYYDGSKCQEREIPRVFVLVSFEDEPCVIAVDAFDLAMKKIKTKTQ